MELGIPSKEYQSTSQHLIDYKEEMETFQSSQHILICKFSIKIDNGKLWIRFKKIKIKLNKNPTIYTNDKLNFALLI